MPPSPDRSRPSRRRVARDLLAFQVKLWLEGLKDIVLVPLSLGAALLDLVLPWPGSRRALRMVMRAGVRFERWVDLYGALDGDADALPDPPGPTAPLPPPPRGKRRGIDGGD